MIELEIPGKPVPKGRPRRSANAGVFTPQATEQAENLVAWYARASRHSFEDSVAVWLEFRCSTRRGDTDNFVKLALDGLQKGGLIKDDRQVDELHAKRVYVAPGDEKTIVRIEAK